MVALAHIEAPCIVNVAKVREIDLVLGAHVTAAERGLFKRDTGLMALGNVEKGSAVGPEQPLVGRENHKIRVEALHVYRQYTDALRGVDKEGRSLLPKRCAHFFEVDDAAFGPLHG